jgi:hypothetical protein
MRGVIHHAREPDINWLKRIAYLSCVLLDRFLRSRRKRLEGPSAPRSGSLSRHDGWITDADGREEKTRIVSVSGDIVTTSAGDEIRRLRTADVTRVRARRSDSLINGALIRRWCGGGLGAVPVQPGESWEKLPRRRRADASNRSALAPASASASMPHPRTKDIYETSRGSTRVHAAPISVASAFDAARTVCQVICVMLFIAPRAQITR